MSFKFSEIPGIDSELAAKLDADPAATGFVDTYATSQIEEAVTNRVDVAKSAFKSKMDALNSKLVAATERLDAGETIDAEELAALRAARDKSPELQATLKALEEKAAGNEAELQAARAEVGTMRLGQTVNRAISEYNAAHPTTMIKPDVHDLVSMLASDALKYDETSKSYQVFDKSGNILATDKGAATPVDWLVKQRDERPSLFSAPAGSGAPGSGNNSGSADKTLSRSDFAKLPPLKQSEVARTHTITD